MKCLGTFYKYRDELSLLILRWCNDVHRRSVFLELYNLYSTIVVSVTVTDVWFVLLAPWCPVSVFSVFFCYLSHCILLRTISVIIGGQLQCIVLFSGSLTTILLPTLDKIATAMWYRLLTYYFLHSDISRVWAGENVKLFADDKNLFTSRIDINVLT